MLGSTGPVTGRRPKLGLCIVHSSSSYDFLIGFLRSLRIYHHGRKVSKAVLLVEPIRAELVGIAKHIVQAPSIGLKLSNLLYCLISIGYIPSIFRQKSRIITKWISCRTTGPACIFPLGLGREAASFPLCIFIGGEP